MVNQGPYAVALRAVFAAMAAVPLPALAGEDSTDRWFLFGMGWYEHPCSRDDLALFGVYGQWDTPENRRNYEITKRDPSQCAKLFPMPPVSHQSGKQSDATPGAGHGGEHATAGGTSTRFSQAGRDNDGMDFARRMGTLGDAALPRPGRALRGRRVTV